MPVLFGVDNLFRHPKPLPDRIGLVTNDAARTASVPSLFTRLALLQNGFNLVRLFSPEHGLTASHPDGAPVSHSSDPLTGLPVVSLYGERMAPSSQDLAGLDCILFDIPNIGARFYTYIWTLWHTLQACATHRLPLFILDRPNPIGANLNTPEGPMLDLERHSSFLGRASIPIRYSLTTGELAQLWNLQSHPKAELHIVQASGWQRDEHWPKTGLPFIPTSPAIPTYESALLYPGICLLEGTNLSIGRGTPLPFQMLGAPWLKAQAIAEAFNRRALSGVRAFASDITPAQNPWAKTSCSTVRLTLTDPQSVRPVAVGLTLLALILAEHRKDFLWTGYPTAANPSGQHHFERLIGQSGIREVFEESPTRAIDYIPKWTDAPGWAQTVQPALLYP